jgi:phosphoenolpyruvate phosphomutase
MLPTRAARSLLPSVPCFNRPLWIHYGGPSQSLGRICEEIGFKVIWASGLSISAALGVFVSNEVSWTQVLEVLEYMNDSTSILIPVDGDTRYGNFNNMRRSVRKLEQRGIAGVCIEDKLFTETNSFLVSDQPLADIEEFCGKLKAGKDSQNNDDFSIIARIEALISGWGMNEALKRADAYYTAGADGDYFDGEVISLVEFENASDDNINGEFIGLLKLSEAGAAIMQKPIRAM